MTRSSVPGSFPQNHSYLNSFRSLGKPEDIHGLIEAQLSARSIETVKETMVLRVTIVDAKLTDKEKKEKPKQVLPGPKGFFCNLDIVNGNKQPVSVPGTRQKTKCIDDKFPVWREVTFLFSSFFLIGKRVFYLRSHGHL